MFHRQDSCRWDSRRAGSPARSPLAGRIEPGWRRGRDVHMPLLRNPTGAPNVRFCPGPEKYLGADGLEPDGQEVPASLILWEPRLRATRSRIVLHHQIARKH